MFSVDDQMFANRDRTSGHPKELLLPDDCPGSPSWAGVGERCTEFLNCKSQMSNPSPTVPDFVLALPQEILHNERQVCKR